MKEFIEKLIGRLEEYRNFEDHDNLDRQCIDGAIEIVNQLAEEYKHCTLCYLQHPCEYQNENIELPLSEWADSNGWIPCSSGYFPAREVLVCKEDGTIDFDVFDFGDEDWKFNSNHHKNKVIAWQPLPEPYKEETT